MAQTTIQTASAQTISDGFQPRLLQIELSSSVIRADSPLILTYWWSNLGTTPSADTERVFVHIRRVGESEAAPNGIRIGGDHEPPVPTHRWYPGRLVRYLSQIYFPASTPPGEYVVLMGLVGAEGRHPLELPRKADDSEENRYEVAHFQIVAPDAASAQQPVTNNFFPLPEPKTAPYQRPANVIALGDAKVLKVTFDAASPRIVSYQMGGKELSGDPESEEPLINILSVADNRVGAADVPPFGLHWKGVRQGKRLVYHATLNKNEQTIGAFDIAFEVQGAQVSLAVENIVESSDYQLVSVRFDRLVAAHDGAKLALPNDAGRLIDPLHSQPTQLISELTWFNPVLAGVVYNRELLCALTVDGVDNRFVATTGKDWAALGASFEHRSPATNGIPSLKLAANAHLVLRFLAPAGRAPDWCDGVRLLRQDLTAKPSRLYEKSVLYKIMCDVPGAPEITTFPQALDLVRRYSHLIDGAPQVVYLVGWQHTGHDTGYPDISVVNQRLGGNKSLQDVMARAKAWNAEISFHDNFDDAYANSPTWNTDMVAHDASGALMKGGVWAGGQSYILDSAKYGHGPALERVRRTLASYPIRHSYHIDVLSTVVNRHDYNPASPASGQQSTAGKIAVIEEFNQHGVDVTSEGLTAPFIGSVHHFWHLRRDRDVFFPGETRIPFVPFLYHGHVTWGGGEANASDIAEAVLYGATFSADFTRQTPDSELTDSYYLLTVPHLLLRNREMTGYRAADGVRRVEYGPSSYVSAKDDGTGYDVVVDGRLVARNFASFAPNWRGDAWIAYACDGGAIDFPAPPHWNVATRIHAITLTAEGVGQAIPIQLAEGHLHLTLPRATPVRLTYH